MRKPAPYRLGTLITITAMLAPLSIALAESVDGTKSKTPPSQIIDKGKGTVTIQVHEVFGAGDFIVPGASVDVLIIREIPSSGRFITDVLVSNARVLGIDQDTSEVHEVSKGVMLEVDPGQAEKLAAGAQVGTLSLVLRR